jgi:hypothetical protein
MTPPELPFGFETAILEEAVRSPSVAMMRLSIEVDRQLRLILAATGQLYKYTGQSPDEALRLIAELMTVPEALRGTLETFWNLRNDVVHGHVSQHLTIRAVDYGLRILKMLHSIPRRSYIVTDSTIRLFSDPEGKSIRADVHGVTIKTLGPHGGVEHIRVHPTRREYLSGQNVSWEWALRGPGWGETWYESMPFGTVTFAWSASLEFIGRPLEEI